MVAVRSPTRRGLALLLPLDGIDPSDEPRVGGKAAHLSRLMRGGLPVPPGFVIPTDAFGRFVEGAGGAGAGCPSIPFPPGLDVALREAVCALPGGEDAPLAVRSSAVGEDAAGRSFAGQYDSFLGVRGLPALLDAVRATWESWFSERARLYRSLATADGGTLLPSGMAVLVQVMVPARAAGVLFTVNPQSGAPDEMAVEAVLGLGSGLAAGTQEADLVIVRRPPWPRRAGVLRVKSRRLACKGERQVVAAQGGLRVEVVPEPRASAPALPDGDLLDLCRLALRVEELAGAPQDMEWAQDETGRLHLLQARPVTAASGAARAASGDPTPAGSGPPRNGVVYTLRFSGERWSEPVTPLSWSILEPVLNWFIRWEDAERRFLQGAPPIRLYRGLPYFNISLFRRLVFRLPGWAPPHFLLEFFPEEERDELLARPAYAPDVKVLASIFTQVFRERRHERYAWSLLRNHEEWERFQPQLQRRTRAIRLDAATPGDALREVDAARQLVLEYVRIHLLSLLFANLFYQALTAMLEGFAPGDAASAAATLTTEPSGNRTVLCNKALWTLAAEAAASPALAAALSAPDPPTLEALRSLPGGPGFARALDGFLGTYGHRAATSWEVFSPRWSDAPGQVLGLVGAYLRGGIRTDPFIQEDRQIQERDRLHREVRRRLTSHPLRRLAFDQVLFLTRRYTVLRENQRFAYDELLHRLQRVLVRTGDLLHAEGALSAPDLLPFLTLDEVRELPSAPPARRGDLAALARERRAQRELDRRAFHPDFLYGDEEPVPPAPRESSRLAGLGISPGRVTGPVRVLRGLDEVGKLQRGDILVTRATDPGWTPLFLTAGGLVMELGSLLSHGAVVAREYRLPAVVNVSGATRVLRDGQEVTVDGATGLIHLH